MALPPNWARYTTEDGKEYFHNAVTNSTQWETPEWPGQAPESLSFQSEVYQYRPNSTDLEVTPRETDEETGRMVGMAGRGDPSGSSGKAGAVGALDSESISLRVAQGGPAAPGAGGGAGGSSSSFGGGGGGGLLGGMWAAASAEDGGDRIKGYAGWALSYAQQFFAVSSDDVVKRVRLSMYPMKTSAPSADATNEFRDRPDFWGPFWVATTAVLFFAATGNFARLLEMDESETFKADYSLVSLASSMVYGCLLGVPLITRIATYFAGEQGDSVNFRQIICVYGYSLTPSIPASIICLLPVSFTRWLAVLAGLALSLVFIRRHLWSDLVIEAPSLKWKMIGLFSAAQATIFLVYRVHFL